VLGGVLRQAATIVITGLAMGLVGAWFASRLVEGLLFGLTAHDPYTLGVAGTTLAVTAMLAGFLPARRAAQVDPAITLRTD
jgi:ABC-type antimicrobial peptide transport system permease subunit